MEKKELRLSAKALEVGTIGRGKQPGSGLALLVNGRRCLVPLTEEQRAIGADLFLASYKSGELELIVRRKQEA